MKAKNTKSSAAAGAPAEAGAKLADLTAWEMVVDPAALVDCAVEVYWPDDKVFYQGVIIGMNKQGKHRVRYTDGDSEQLALKDEKFRLIDDVKTCKRIEPPGQAAGGGSALADALASGSRPRSAHETATVGKGRSKGKDIKAHEVKDGVKQEGNEEAAPEVKAEPQDDGTVTGKRGAAPKAPAGSSKKPRHASTADAAAPTAAAPPAAAATAVDVAEGGDGGDGALEAPFYEAFMPLELTYSCDVPADIMAYHDYPRHLVMSDTFMQVQRITAPSEQLLMMLMQLDKCHDLGSVHVSVSSCGFRVKYSSARQATPARAKPHECLVMFSEEVDPSTARAYRVPQIVPTPTQLPGHGLVMIAAVKHSDPDYEPPENPQ